jgi:hypothetical protein
MVGNQTLPYHQVHSTQQHTPTTLTKTKTAINDNQTMSSLCQICGARFYDDDLASNPLSHFCIGLDGPAIVHFETEEHQNSAPHTPEFEKPKNATQPKG